MAKGSSAFMIEEEEDLCLFGITYYLAFKNGLFKNLYLVKEKGILKIYIKKKKIVHGHKNSVLWSTKVSHIHTIFWIFIYIYIYIPTYYLVFKNGLFKKLYLVKEKGILKSYIKKKNSTRTQK